MHPDHPLTRVAPLDHLIDSRFAGNIQSVQFWITPSGLSKLWLLWDNDTDVPSPCHIEEHDTIDLISGTRGTMASRQPRAKSQTTTLILRSIVESIARASD